MLRSYLPHCNTRERNPPLPSQNEDQSGQLFSITHVPCLAQVRRLSY